MKQFRAKSSSDNRKSKIKIPKLVGALALAVIFAMGGAGVEAQQLGKMPRIGVLISGSRGIASPRINAFQQGLRELGYVEGQNIRFEYRYAEGKLEPVAEFAAELVGLNVDILVVDTSFATEAAKNATKTIPIVFTTANDPVGDHQVESLARPGGNLTGFSVLALDLNGKRLELLKEAFSTVTRVGFLTRTGPKTGELRFREAETDAKRLGLRLQRLSAKGPEELESVFDAAKRSGVQAVLAHQSSFVSTNRAQIIKLAVKYRLPAVFHSTELAEAGGLMSYGPDIADNFRRAAVYVDKILKGTKPADLPVQQPMKFVFVVNLKTAKEIGLTIPPNVLVRADRVIR